MHESLVLMLFPVLGAYISGSEFQYPNLTLSVTPFAYLCIVIRTGDGDGNANF